MGDASQPVGAGGSLALQAGSKVGPGRFILIKELGRGGMGVVWLAQDTNLGEQVALKFLPPEVAADPVALNDLRRETVRSHRLTHPNIIRIHDFHQQPDGIAFISMEYVDGMTLSGWRLQQANQVFTWEQLAPLVQQLCVALEYAHGEGVVHRDLKPANVMLDSRGRVKLADFGIAAVVSDSVSRVSVRSSTGGTLAYMSPQQIRGQTPTVADDVYALGASVYELLTGRPPFYRGDITHQALNEPAAPLADRVLELGVDNPVPDQVGALVMACLAKEPEGRPTSARAVAEWIGLETFRKPSLEGMAEALFPKTDAHAASPEAEAHGSEVAVAAAAGSKLAWGGGLVVSALLRAGGGVWYWTTRPWPKGPTSVQPTPSPAIATDKIPAPATATTASPEPGFVSLFDGHDLSGWQGDPRIWSVKDGVLTGQTTPNATPDGCLVWTNGTVTDFELRFLFHVPQAKSQVVYRAKDFGNGAESGYLFTIPGMNAIGGLFERGTRGTLGARGVSGRGWLGRLGTRVKVGANGGIQTDGTPSATADQALAAIKTNDWNEGVIIAQQYHLTHLINGVVVTEVTDLNPARRHLSGVIGLATQATIGQGTLVQFKNIRLKRLPPSADPTGRTTASRSSPLDLSPGQR